MFEEKKGQTMGAWITTSLKNTRVGFLDGAFRGDKAALSQAMKTCCFMNKSHQPLAGSVMF